MSDEKNKMPDDETQYDEAPVEMPKKIEGNSAEAVIPQEMEYGLHYAGFWIRFWAYLLDLIVIGSLSRIFIYPIFRQMGWALSDTGLFSPVGIATGAVFYLYFVLMTRYFSQTIGKMVFGLRVTSLDKEKLTWKSVLFREFVGRYISATIIVLYLLVAFLPKKQGLHDYFADTAIIHERTVVTQKPAYS